MVCSIMEHAGCVDSPSRGLPWGGGICMLLASRSSQFSHALSPATIAAVPLCVLHCAGAALVAWGHGRRAGEWQFSRMVHSEWVHVWSCLFTSDPVGVQGPYKLSRVHVGCCAATTGIWQGSILDWLITMHKPIMYVDCLVGPAEVCWGRNSFRCCCCWNLQHSHAPSPAPSGALTVVLHCTGLHWLL
jgi:hypothetical protein